MIRIYNQQNKEKVSEHFNSEEFECGCCRYAIIDTTLVFALEQFRAWNGGKRLIIKSGYRCPKHNDMIGGGVLSRHMMGYAADVQWDGCSEQLSNLEWRKALKDKAEDMGIFGLGFGPVFLHIDVDANRKRLKTWEYFDGKATEPEYAAETN